jgi:hypothetical protein
MISAMTHSITFARYEGSIEEGYHRVEIVESEFDQDGRLTEPATLSAGLWLWAIDGDTYGTTMPTTFVNGITVTHIAPYTSNTERVMNPKSGNATFVMSPGVAVAGNDPRVTAA